MFVPIILLEMMSIQNSKNICYKFFKRFSLCSKNPDVYFLEEFGLNPQSWEIIFFYCI